METQKATCIVWLPQELFNKLRELWLSGKVPEKELPGVSTAQAVVLAFGYSAFRGHGVKLFYGDYPAVEEAAVIPDAPEWMHKAAIAKLQELCQ